MDVVLPKEFIDPKFYYYLMNKEKYLKKYPDRKDFLIMEAEIYNKWENMSKKERYEYIKKSRTF